MPESDAACALLRTDHRAIEEHLDKLLAALLDLRSERIPEIQATVSQLRALAKVHFRKEEEIFYPKVRTLDPELLHRLDEQHEDVREAEGHLAELLSDLPQATDPRWMNELRMFGIGFHDRIQHHIVDEEDQLFRIAHNRLSTEEQESLASAMKSVTNSA
ncbi:MAG: hemerythrin domain-containing protein [Bryobacteraceae bacterium]